MDVSSRSDAVDPAFGRHVFAEHHRLRPRDQGVGEGGVDGLGERLGSVGFRQFAAERDRSGARPAGRVAATGLVGGERSIS